MVSNELEEISEGMEGIIIENMKLHNAGGYFSPRLVTQELLQFEADNEVGIRRREEYKNIVCHSWVKLKDLLEESKDGTD